MNKEVFTNYDVWCYTTSKTSARKKVSRAKSKAVRAKTKRMVERGDFE